jgi:RNA polymerase sigma factor (sigma-70 family)
MAKRDASLAQSLRRLASSGEGPSDAELLGRFLAGPDEEAFAALVRRHGPMVYGACRRLLHNDQDAEDAFQATFLVLARKARAIANRAALGNWLYGVAYRTALKARAARARRLAGEMHMRQRPQPTAHPAGVSELELVLDQELNALPDRYRLPVVLCDLEGLSRKEAAERLGVTEGTLSAQLFRARRRLAERLRRHGLPLGALGALLGQVRAGAAPPTATVEATVKAGVVAATAPAALAGVVSPTVLSLTTGVIKAMYVHKLKHLAALLTALVGALGIGWACYLSSAPAPAPPRATSAGAPPEEGGKGAAKEDALIAAMKFVKVPKGTFWMGGESGKPPTKQVEIKEDFELAAYAVTQEQWQAVMGHNPSCYSRGGERKGVVKDVADAALKRFPVESVSWDDAQAFLKKLNEREKGRGWVYRLPTEAEWEYACRGAATSKEDCSFDFYLAGPTNDLSSLQANFHGQFPAGKAAKGPFLGRPTSVGSYPPNRLGLYDMHGNVWQWCQDLDEKGPARRVIRGGHWEVSGRGCRAAHRGAVAPATRSIDTGFRIARVPKEPRWGYGLTLKCRPGGKAGWGKARAFGLDVYRDRGRALYVTEAGTLAAGAFRESKQRPPTWLHGLTLKARPAGFAEFPPKAFGVEVYRDEHNGHWLYLCETGAFAALPGAGPHKPAPKAQAARWLYGLELKVRRADQKSFDRDTKTWGLEVYRDDNNGNLIYVSERGTIAVVREDDRGGKAPRRPPLWLNGFTLEVRKAGAARAEKFGVEAYRDENNGNLIYVSETGSLAVVPGKEKLPSLVGRPVSPALLSPTLTHSFELKCRKGGEAELAPLTFGMAAFADKYTNCALYISEKGALAAAADR